LTHPGCVGAAHSYKTQGVERHHRSSAATVLLHTVTSKLREAQTRSSFADDLIGLLGGLVDEGLVDVGDHTTAGDGRLDQGVELLVTADGELEVAGRDALDLWVFESSGRRRRSERVVARAVFRREKETDRKTFFERIQNASRRSVDRTRPRPRTETCR
jgi:hypothetical protein